MLNGSVISALSSSTLTKGFQYLQQNPIAEVAFLDVSTMIAPRTAIDSYQNPVYGAETFFRETAPIIFNPFGPGIAALVMMNFFKGGEYKGVTANSKTIENLHEAWNEAGGKRFFSETATQEQKIEVIKDYAVKVLENTEGLSGRTKKIKISKKQMEDIPQKFAGLVLGDNKDEKKASKILNEIAEKYTEKTGAAGSITFRNKHELSTDIHSLLNDAVTVGKKVFVKAGSHDKIAERVKDIVEFAPRKTRWATALSMLGIATLPFINNTITKLRTGKSGYAAYKDFCSGDAQQQAKNKEKNKGLWAKKALTAAGMALMVVTTIGGFNKKTGFFVKGKGLQNFKDKIELKGPNTHMNLIKLVYGTSLISRFMFSRDEQELKVTTVRDYAGFMNWLVLGGFVAKGVAHLADRKGESFVNISAPLKDKNPLKTVQNWLTNVSVKTHSEMRAMTKHLPKAEKMQKMAIHNGAALAGLAWSMFALGIGMPVLCNHMTNKAREKQLREKAQCGCGFAGSTEPKNNAQEIGNIKNQEDISHKLLVNKIFSAQYA